MNGLQTFATFGLPSIALCGALVALWVSRRSAERIDARERQVQEQRAARSA